jgi:hypothetical protein
MNRVRRIVPDVVVGASPEGVRRHARRRFQAESVHLEFVYVWVGTKILRPKNSQCMFLIRWDLHAVKHGFDIGR